MERVTARCSRYGHQEFILFCADEVASDLPWLCQFLEDKVASGTVFAEGETLQVGWSVLTVRSGPSRRLTLWELDMSGTAGQMECSVTRTLLFLRRQRAVLESFGILDQLQFPSVRQTAVFCARFDTASPRMLFRRDGKSDDSGWFFGCTGKDHDHRRRENLSGGSLYEIACANPDVLDFLAMPSGSVVLLRTDGRVEKAFGKDRRKLEIGVDSYLHERDSKFGEA